MKCCMCDIVCDKHVYDSVKYVVLLLHQQQALLGNCDTLFMTLPHEQIREFHKQWYLLTDCALEIFLNTGKTCLLAFNLTKVSRIFHIKGKICKTMFLCILSYSLVIFGRELLRV